MRTNEKYGYFNRFMLSRRGRFDRHLVIQLLLFTLSLNAFGVSSDVFIFNRERFFLWSVFYGMLNLDCYLNMYVFVPRWFFTGKIGKYAFAVAGAISVFMLLLMCMQPVAVTDSTASGIPLFTFINLVSSFVTIGIVIVSTTTFMLFRRWMAEQQRVRELEIATRQSELKFLKQQINPHFLFNMLNNANVLLKRNPQEASRILFKLEDMLRYQLDGCMHETVPLDSEIRFLHDFLNLEKVRRGRFRYSITKEGETSGCMLPPVLFIPFVENAVKHNHDGEKESFVHVSFAKSNGKLSFRCENSKPHAAVSNRRPGGLGLHNIRRRLELLFPGRHTLAVGDEPDLFTVQLTIIV